MLDYTADELSDFSRLIADALRCPSKPERLIRAAATVLPFQAALCVINRRHQAPIYLCDTYPDADAKQAVQRYVSSTYLINPVYNAFLAGLDSGLYRMRDLAPDQWEDNFPPVNTQMNLDKAEEIGYLTHGWPARMEELVMLSRVSEHAMAEISFAQPLSAGGFSEATIQRFQALLPIFAFAMESVSAAAIEQLSQPDSLTVQLEAFASDVLSPRENEVIQLVLKGHSGKSICSALEIAMPTQKSHRKNAYTKLGINNQQELFSMFLQWKHKQELS